MAAVKKRKRAQDEVKHAAILQAAIRLFPLHGYADTSMDAIAAAASVTKQTVYAHYHSKDELFKHMIVALCERNVVQKDALGSETKPIETLLYDAGIAFLNFATSDECIAVTRLVIAEVNRHPKLAQRYYEEGTQRLITTLAQFLKAQNKRGELAIKDAESAASYYIAMLKGRYYLRSILGVKPAPTNKEKEQNVRETVKIFMKLYGGKNALHTKSVL